jgi:hypothetical protein
LYVPEQINARMRRVTGWRPIPPFATGASGGSNSATSTTHSSRSRVASGVRGRGDDGTCSSTVRGVYGSAGARKNNWLD